MSIFKSLFFFCFFFPSVVWAQKTIIQGKAPDYAGKEISFYTYPEPVVFQKKELSRTKIGQDGSFSLTLSTNETIEIYTDLEKYTGSMVIEPGKNYKVTLPPYSPRNGIEAKSPYFQPVLYWLGLPETDSNDLNSQIRSFLTAYNEELIRNTTAIYRNLSRETVQEIIQKLELKFGAFRNDYFQTLKKYYYADLENIVNPGKPEIVIHKYFKKEPVKLTNPAYQKIFRLLFNDFLRQQSLDIKNKIILNLVSNGDFNSLTAYLERQGYQKQIAELVILKGLFDGYHSGFSKGKVIKAVEQAQSSVTGNLVPVVNLIQKKITRLVVKGKAPSFGLNNPNNELISSEKFKGKFVYLGFFRSNSSECKAELDSLKTVEKKFRQVLAVVSISTDENFEASVNLWKQKKYSWELLNGSNKKQLIENYGAEVVPVFYLIDPEGNLVLSPAPSPSHEFEPMFLKLFRDYRFRQGR